MGTFMRSYFCYR